MSRGQTRRQSLFGIWTVAMALIETEKMTGTAIRIVIARDVESPSGRFLVARFAAYEPTAQPGAHPICSYAMPLPSSFEGDTDALLYRGVITLARMLDDYLPEPAA